MAFQDNTVPDGTYTYTGPGTGRGTIKVESGVVTEVTGPAASTTAGKIKLKHGETIVIKDLPAGAKWTIVEDTYTGYTTTVTATGTGATPATSETNSTAKNETGMSDANSAAYINTRSGTIPTGILMTIAPFAALMIVGFVGVVIMLRKKSATNK